MLRDARHPSLSEPTIASLSMQLGILQSEMSGVRDNLKEMTAAITKLAVIEERMVASTLQQERMLEIIRENRSETNIYLEKLAEKSTRLEERLDNLEKGAPLQKLISNWVISGVWAVICIVALFIAKKVGLV